MWVHVYVCAFVCICVHVCAHACVLVYVCVCLYICVYMCICFYMCAQARVCMCMCVCVWTVEATFLSPASVLRVLSLMCLGVVDELPTRHSARALSSVCCSNPHSRFRSKSQPYAGTAGRETDGLVNDALNTFYLRLYGVRHMVNDHSDSDRGNPLILFYMHHPTDRIAHTTAFGIPVVEHWLEGETVQWVHSMKDRSDDPSHHEQTLLPRSYFLSGAIQMFKTFDTIICFKYRTRQIKATETNK